MRERLPTVTVGTTAALLVVVAGVGAVALFAEFRGVWSSYFLMERTIAAWWPVAVGLMGATLATWWATVFAAT